MLSMKTSHTKHVLMLKLKCVSRDRSMSGNLLKGQGGGLYGPLMTSGTIQNIAIKRFTVIVILKAHQNIKINFQKSDL